MLTVTFGESTMSRTQVQLWYNRLKEGREDVNDYAISGRPSTSKANENIEAVKKMILENRRITILEVADDVGISFGSWQIIFRDVLGMKNAAAKIVPNLLNLKQNRRRMDIAQEMLTTCVRLLHWNQSSIIPNGSVQKSQDRKKHIKFGQICGFCSMTVQMAMTLKLNPNYPNWSVQKSQDRKKYVKFGHCFLFRTVNKAYYLEVLCRLRYAILIIDFAPW